MMEEKIIESYVSNGQGEKIYVKQFLPPRKEGEKLPLLIISHGLGLTHRSVEEYAKPLCDLGFAVVTFDFRYANPHSKSGTDTLKVSIKTTTADLELILNWSLELSRVDRSRVFLMGQSLGGATSALVAANYPDSVKALVLFFPAFVIEDEARRRFGVPENVPETFLKWGHFEVGRCYGVDAFNVGFFERIGSFEGDVLIIHGDADHAVPLSYSERAVNAYKHARLIVVPGSDHRFVGDDYALALGEVEKFLTRFLDDGADVADVAADAID